MKITFGIINCNRLFYLRSSVESLIKTTEDYQDKKIIIVDNCSDEEGTEEYLQQKKSQGITVIRTKERDPKNEWARAANSICEHSSDSDLIAPLQGDTQFITKGWLTDYVSIFKENYDNIGALALDAQRKSRNATNSYQQVDDFFVYNRSRGAIPGAGDVIYSKKVISYIYPWEVDCTTHERGGSAEALMLRKIARLKLPPFKFCQPIIPASCMITRDLPSGCNARVSGNKRVGDYWAPKEDNYRYYEIKDYENLKNIFKGRKIPLGKEELAEPVGWNLPLDASGNWIKKPIFLNR